MHMLMSACFDAVVLLWSHSYSQVRAAPGVLCRPPCQSLALSRSPSRSRKGLTPALSWPYKRTGKPFNCGGGGGPVSCWRVGFCGDGGGNDRTSRDASRRCWCGSVLVCFWRRRELAVAVWRWRCGCDGRVVSVSVVDGATCKMLMTVAAAVAGRRHAYDRGGVSGGTKQCIPPSNHLR